MVVRVKFGPWRALAGAGSAFDVGDETLVGLVAAIVPWGLKSLGGRVWSERIFGVADADPAEVFSVRAMWVDEFVVPKSDGRA